jgi:phage terminase large subunit
LKTDNTLSSEPIIRRLNPKQDQFVFNTDHFVCIKGTWGCGKSLAGLIAACLECETYPNNLYLVIRNEYVDLRDSTMKDWEKEFGDRYPIISNDVRFPNGSILMFRHGDDLNSLKNVNLGGALMIQAEEMEEEDFWFLNGRLRRQEGTRQLRLECNYNGHNWIWKMFNQGIKSDNTPFKGTLIITNTFDNEINLPSDYIPNLRMLPKKLQDRNLYGSDADMQGQIWEMWSEDKHVIKPFKIPYEWEKFTVSDTPVASGVLATTWWAVDHDGVCYIYDEYQEDNRLISQHCETLLSKTEGIMSQWIADTSAFNKTREKNGILYSVVDEFRDYGINLVPAQKDVYAGINRVGEYLTNGKLKVFENCTLVRDKMPQYRWAELKPNARGEALEVPYRVDTHLVETVRYGIMSRPEAAIIDRSPKITEHSLARILKEDEAIKAKEFV